MSNGMRSAIVSIAEIVWSKPEFLKMSSHITRCRGIAIAPRSDAREIVKKSKHDPKGFRRSPCGGNADFRSNTRRDNRPHTTDASLRTPSVMSFSVSDA